MSFNVNSLPAYTDQLSTDLISAALLKSFTTEFVTIEAGKTAGTSAINLLNSTVDILPATCGFASGQGGQLGSNATVFSQIPLVVASKMLKEQMCPETLRTKWTSSQLGAAANQETVPFAELIANNKMANIAKYVENTIWQGDGVGGTLDGLLYQTEQAQGAIPSNGAYAQWTTSTAIAEFWLNVGSLTPDLQTEDDLIMYTSYANYQALVAALINTGASVIGQFAQVSNASGVNAPSSFVFPGTNITVFAAPGINDPARVILAPKKYIFFGTGLLDEMDTFKFYYNEADDIMNFSSKFRLGTAAYASQVVSNL
jgi:hypothetical protein